MPLYRYHGTVPDSIYAEKRDIYLSPGSTVDLSAKTLELPYFARLVSGRVLKPVTPRAGGSNEPPAPDAPPETPPETPPEQ